MASVVGVSASVALVRVVHISASRLLIGVHPHGTTRHLLSEMMTGTLLLLPVLVRWHLLPVHGWVLPIRGVDAHCHGETSPSQVHDGCVESGSGRVKRFPPAHEVAQFVTTTISNAGATTKQVCVCVWKAKSDKQKQEQDVWDESTPYREKRMLP